MTASDYEMFKVDPYIETYTGKKFYFLTPTEDMVDIRDIAHALSCQPRYSGHTRKFYSVAEHSVLVSRLAKNKKKGLLHDGSEYVLLDIAKPIKPHLKNYYALEDGVMKVIARKYGFDWPMDEDTKDADTVQLKTEARHLMSTRGKDWVKNFPTTRKAGIIPACLPPKAAERLFLNRFIELFGDEYENL